MRKPDSVFVAAGSVVAFSTNCQFPENGSPEAGGSAFPPPPQASSMSVQARAGAASNFMSLGFVIFITASRSWLAKVYRDCKKFLSE
jgi:hypothetical protein